VWIIQGETTMNHDFLRSIKLAEYTITDITFFLRLLKELYSQRDNFNNVSISEDWIHTHQGFLFKLRKDATKLSRDNSNGLEWNKTITILDQFESLLKKKGDYLSKRYETDGVSFYNLINEIELLLYRLNKKSITSDNVGDSMKSRRDNDDGLLVERFRKIISQNEIFFEGNESILSGPEIKDFLLISFYADKDEIHFSGLNELAGKFLSTQSREFIEGLDRTGLEDFVSNHIEDEFEGDYIQTGVYINSADDTKIFTDQIETQEIDLEGLESLVLEKTIGEFFLEQMDREIFPYYLVQPTNAPAEMTILFILKERFTLPQIQKRLRKVIANDYWVGMAFDDEIETFDLGLDDWISYDDPYLVTREKLLRLSKIPNKL
jgi:hypothetical protein